MFTMTSMFITSLSLCLLCTSYADCSVSAADDEVDLHSRIDNVDADETSLLHTRLLVRRQERSATRLRATSFTKFRSKQRQDPDKVDEVTNGIEERSDYDVGPNGNPCTVCSPPKPGTGYDGMIGIKTSDLSGPPDLARLHAEGKYLIRDDCGNHFDDLEGVVWSDYVYNTSTATHNAFPGYTNAWCEIGYQQVAADTLINRDPLYEGKVMDMELGYTYDFFYCKYLGFLSLSARQAFADGFETAQAYARNFCSETESKFGKGFIEGISYDWWLDVFFPGMMRDPPKPTEEEAKKMGAWLCAMGGTNGFKGGLSDGPLPDIGYCQYTYGDVGNGEFCMYHQCCGWDPVTGMPVTELVTRAA